MQVIEIDCATGDAVQRDMTPDEVTEQAASTAQAQAAQAEVEREKQAVQQAQLTTAQELIATSSNQRQADAMTAFMRTLGLPL